jgi:hypothetical protein
MLLMSFLNKIQSLCLKFIPHLHWKGLPNFYHRQASNFTKDIKKFISYFMKMNIL